jgi:hypothetical protein
MRQEASLDITSETLSLAHLERALRLNGDPGSRSRGDLLPGDRIATVSILRIEPNLGQDATLEQQLDAIGSRMPADRLRAADLQVDVTFTIAVYFDTAYATTIVAADLVAWTRDYSAAIQVVAYPISD